VTRPASRSAATGSLTWFNENAATTASNERDANGRCRASPATAGGRCSRSVLSMPTATSTATGQPPAPRMARLAAPVPAPRSRQSRPANGGSRATSTSASRS
jgi:hypothetical protein